MQCTLCPLKCGADREKQAGRCGVKGLSIAKYYLHPYEEPPICHTNGAGAVFFCGCSLRCVFCQNYEVSRARRGKAVSPRELAQIFRGLEEAGADSLDLVTGDHVADRLAEALSYYKPNIPVVFNSGGYISLRAIELLEPFIDIWMPDCKFFSKELSKRYTGRADYFEVASAALSRMAKKPALWDGNKLLTGIMVRHLVLPGCTSDSLKILDFLKDILPADAPLSIMRQYTPMGEIEGFPELQRKITAREYRRVVDYALALGFTRIYTQGKESASASFVPVWDDALND